MRQEWMDNNKLARPNQNDLLDKTKEELLHDLLHPEEIYMKPKKPEYEIVKESYEKSVPLLKSTYNEAARFNLEPNYVDFQMYNTEKNDKQKQAKKHLDYVKTFYDKFSDILIKNSPEYWKLLLFDLFRKILDCKLQSNEDLSHELNTLIPNEDQPIKYLVTFRN